MTEPISIENAHRLACTLRDACIRAALNAYESGGISGLCAEGRWEAAINAMEMLDVGEILTVEFGVGRSETDKAQAP